MVDTDTTPTTDREAPSTSTRVGVIAGAVLVGVVLLLGAAWGAARILGSGETWDVVPGQPVEVTIQPGASAAEIYRTLDAAGVVRSGDLQATVSALGVESLLRAGTYTFLTDADPDEVVQALTRGPAADAAGRFVVVEGWTVDRIVQELAAALSVTQGEVQRILRSGDVQSPYLPDVGGPIDELNRWEGLLAAATYPVGPETAATDLLGAMASESTRRLDELDWSRIEALGVSRHDAVVIASLVEREAGTDDERTQISSVIHNRLDRGMRLQIDATVIYALGYNPGRVSAADLDVESPWNTYRNDGLPPTPIGAPSIASLDAAVDPATTDYLFYVLGASDGSHLFAETYEGHQQNIEQARADGVLP